MAASLNTGAKALLPGPHQRSKARLEHLQPCESQWQKPHQPLRPGSLAGLVSDQVLPDLDLDMGNAAPLAMDGNAVVGLVADVVGLVVADHQVSFLFQQIVKDARERGISIVQHADMPGAWSAMRV